MLREETGKVLVGKDFPPSLTARFGDGPLRLPRLAHDPFAAAYREGLAQYALTHRRTLLVRCPPLSVQTFPSFSITFSLQFPSIPISGIFFWNDFST